MIKFRLKDILGDVNTVLHVLAFGDLYKVLNILKLLPYTGGSGVTSKIFNEFLRSIKEDLSIGSSVGEQGVEMISAPFDAMLNLIREISECAHWNGLFGRIL